MAGVSVPYRLRMVVICDNIGFRLKRMITDWLTTLHDLGNAIYDAFFLPGDFVLLQFVALAPTLALMLGIDADSDVIALSAILSLLIWLLLVSVVWKFFRFLQNVLHSVTAAFSTIVFRVSLASRSFKTKLLCGLLKLLPRRRSSGADSNPEVEFDDLDLAVLRNCAAAGGGFVVSAPGLAEQLTMRPAQVQRSLDKLRNYRMVDVVIGSTDGFDNYRLTQSGVAFLAALQRTGIGGQPPTATALVK